MKLRTAIALIMLLSGSKASADNSLFRDLTVDSSLRVYRSVRGLPSVFRENLRGALDQERLVIAEPGEPFQTSDAVIVKEGEQPRPTRRLIFAAGNEDVRLFYYEVGGYGGGGATVLVFKCDAKGVCKVAWTGVEFTRRYARSPKELIARIVNRKIQEFDRR